MGQVTESVGRVFRSPRANAPKEVKGCWGGVPMTQMSTATELRLSLANLRLYSDSLLYLFGLLSGALLWLELAALSLLEFTCWTF